MRRITLKYSGTRCDNCGCTLEQRREAYYMRTREAGLRYFCLGCGSDYLRRLRADDDDLMTYHY